MKSIRASLGAALVVATFSLAMAKLPPAPPMTDAQKAVAEEAKGKAAAAAELANKQQASAEDRVAARYFADMKAKGKSVAPPYVASAQPSAPQPPAASAIGGAPAAK